MQKLAIAFAICGSLAFALPAFAQTGPVATVCASDIQKFCAGKGHGQRQTRSCLEANREKLSAECQNALTSTRGGRR